MARNAKNRSKRCWLNSVSSGWQCFWEAFVHDLIIAYIEERSETCVKFHKNQLHQSIVSKNKAVAKWVTITVPAALKRAQIEFMVDPNGFNITAESADKLALKASQLLEGTDAKKFSLSGADRAFVDLLIAIRNFLSHRSSGSSATLKQRLAELHKADATSPLNGKVTTVGAYLKARPAGAVGSRAKLIGNILGI